MKKILKNNKGFSLVELLIALLIMGVIAAIAIGLFSGVLNSSKTSADREAGNTIEKALMTYAAASNDYGLEGLGLRYNASGVLDTTNSAKADAIVNALTGKITVTVSGANISTAFSNCKDTTLTAIASHAYYHPNIYSGIYGPFLDRNKSVVPQNTDNLGWTITLHTGSQTIGINATGAAAAVVETDGN